MSFLEKTRRNKSENGETDTLIVDFVTTGKGFSQDDSSSFMQTTVFDDKPENKAEIVIGLELPPNSSLPIAYQVILREDEAGPDDVFNVVETKCFSGRVTADSGGDLVKYTELSVAGLGPFNPAEPPKRYTVFVPVVNMKEMAVTVAAVGFQVRSSQENTTIEG